MDEETAGTSGIIDDILGIGVSQLLRTAKKDPAAGTQTAHIQIRMRRDRVVCSAGDRQEFNGMSQCSDALDQNRRCSFGKIYHTHEKSIPCFGKNKRKIIDKFENFFEITEKIRYHNKLKEGTTKRRMLQ